MSDLYEVEAGKIASEKGQSEAVKEFGRHMVEAHSKTSEELKGIVQAEKLNVELPAKLDQKRQKLIDALNDAKPEDFDKIYAKQQVKAHERPSSCSMTMPRRRQRRVEAVRREHAADDQAAPRARPRSCRNRVPCRSVSRPPPSGRPRGRAREFALARRLYRNGVRSQPARFMALIRRARTTFQRFAESEASGGLVLMASAALGMVVANSAFASNYTELLHTKVAGLNVLHWINDGLMALFFLLVGLEIKREILAGELDSWPRRALPFIAAFGGMIAPALIFFAINWQSPETWRGWAIPTATDIAFALGVLSLFGSRIPNSLKVFLTSLAIMDDLGAILIIAIFYASDLSVGALGVAALVTAALFALNWFGVVRLAPYLLLGVVLWAAMLSQAFTPRSPAWCWPGWRECPREHCRPERHAEQKIGEASRPTPNQLSPNNTAVMSAATPRAMVDNIGGVEDGDDEDGTEVIHDRKRSQKHFERAWNSRPEQREHAEREGDVGGGRYRPSPPSFRAPPVDREKDQRRRDHAP